MRLFLIALKEEYVRNIEILRKESARKVMDNKNYQGVNWEKHYEEAIICQIEARTASDAIKRVSENYILEPESLSAYEIIDWN